MYRDVGDQRGCSTEENKYERFIWEKVHESSREQLVIRSFLFESR